jgi:hypothetical protein
MMFVKTLGVAIVGVAIIVTGGCRSACPCSGGTSELKSPCSVPAEERAGIEVGLSLLEKQGDNGVCVHVEIANRGSASHSLQVCPAMTICCVRGLHMIVSYGDTGVGLLDACKTKKPTPHEVFLPAGATFGFDMTIPEACLPEEAAKEGSDISLQLCYDLSDGAQVSSSIVRVRR